MKNFSALTQQQIQGDDIMLSGICLDSRKVKRGDLFLAIKGEQVDGHKFIRQAIDQGAVAIAMQDECYAESLEVPYIIDRHLIQNLGSMAAAFYGNASESLHVVGVTGTNGKSSVASYSKQLLLKLGERSAEIGTLGISYPDENGIEKIINTENTTPDAITLQGVYALMVEEKLENLIMEVSSHALQQKRCVATAINTAVFTNLTQDHLDYHASMQVYGDVKTSLFTDYGIQYAIVNIDDALSDSIIAKLDSSVVLTTYSLESSEADLSFSNIQLSASGTHACLLYKGKTYTCHLSLIGRFNCANVLAVIAVALNKGFHIKEIINHLVNITPVDGRMEIVSNDKKINAIVDYAHTPDALENILKTLTEFKQARLILVFGCGGDRDKSKRENMAKIAECYADTIIVTADNPRNESLSAIFTDINKGFTHDAMLFIDDRKEAIEAAVNIANEKDIIVIAGKGHEKFQLINNEKIAFDDVKELKHCLMRLAS